MAPLSKLDLHRTFDEASYLRRSADVQAGIEAGHEENGWSHFTRHGFRENRRIVDFDLDFYQQSYPLVAADIRAGLAETPYDHYVLYGRGRGYLPNRSAERPDYGAGFPSRFGGLWIDAPDASARVQGRLETGQITTRQAYLLTAFIRDGYVILEGAVPPGIVESALELFDKAYQGGFETLRFECPQVDRTSQIPWREEINQYPSKALDLHMFGSAIRNLIFAPKISEFLGLIFDAKALASQTLGFLLGSAQEGHQDSAYVPYTLARSFCASWVALEDVTVGAGELFYYPGSHRIPDFLYEGRFKSVTEARRILGGESYAEHVRQHVQSLIAKAAEFELPREVFAAKKGDALIWHADLVHGGNPVSQTVTRKSIVTHYCPKYLVPLYAEQSRARFYDHVGHLYGSSLYQQMAPLP